MPHRGGRGKRSGHIPIQPRGGRRGHFAGLTRGGRGAGNSGGGEEAGYSGGDRPREGNAAHFRGRPPGLRGRDIGLWHAQRSQADKASMQDPKYYLALSIGVDQETQLITSVNEVRDELRRLQIPERPLGIVVEEPSRSHAPRPPTTNLANASRSSALPDVRLNSASLTATSSINSHGSNTVTDVKDDDEDDDDDVVELCDEEELIENGTLSSSSALTAGAAATSDAAFRALLMQSPEAPAPGIRSRPSGIFSEAFDSELRADYARRMDKPSSKLLKMLEYRKTLPVYQQRQHILASIKSSQVVVISGETGCGKTTQVPQYLLDDYLSQAAAPAATFVKPFRIMVTQPRRISAISVADRVASERDEKAGTSVGYIVRLEHELPRSHASITYCTTGILLQWLKSDPKLSGITHVMLDEIHEQDISSDFLMIILKKLLAGERRNDLKVVLMSATLNSEKFSSYFDAAPLIHVPGFTYPVKQYFVEDVMQMFLTAQGGGARVNTIEQRMSTVRMPAFRRRYGRGSKGDSNARDEEHQFNSFVKTVIKPQYGTRIANMMEHLRQNEGRVNLPIIEELVAHLMQTTPHSESILIFVPGWAEIQKLHQAFSQKFGRSHVIIPLHSMLPTSQQRSVFERTPLGQRKLVIASSIAETSITIDDIVHVIDSGLARMSDFDPETNVQLLDTVFETKANLTQRKGRAGRVKAGCSYHLISRHRFESMEDYQKPELLRSRLENVCLQVKILGYQDVHGFLAQAVQPPPPATVASAIEMLKNINAFDRTAEEALTPLGRHLTHLPMDPLLGRTLLYAAIFSCLEPVANICACLGYKDPFVVPFGCEEAARKKKEEFARETASDHLACHYALRDFEQQKKESRDNDDHGRGLREWCWESFVSKETANLLIGMRNQFGSYLKALNFISNSNIRDSRFNRNSDNALLIVSVVALGLYPNWGCVPHTFGTATVKKHAQELFQLEVGFLGEKNKKKVKVHANSVVNRLLYVDRGYMAFSFARRMDNAYFVYDASFVTSPMLLALACDEMLTKREKEYFTLIVDDWVHLRSNDRSYKCMVYARQAFSSLLLRAYASPAEYMPRLHSGTSVENKFLAGLWRAVADELDLSAGDWNQHKAAVIDSI